ncbi:MAG TPA: hypothetical protein VHY08_20635, partial [Bacillota bacterium]|nr:hypothetical protein [Bacillota bacterium]
MNSNDLLINILLKFSLPFFPGFSYQLSGGNSPGSRVVIRELHKILREDPFFKTQNFFFSLDKIKWLNAFFDFLAFLFHYPLLILLGIAVLFGLYFLIRSITPLVKSKSFDGASSKQLISRNKALPPNHFLTLYQHSLDQARAGQYKPALISLHKATVEYLLTKIIITGSQKKYTNNDLKKRLGADQALYQPFCVITRYAEIAGFSAIDITPSDFQAALEAFEKAF